MTRHRHWRYSDEFPGYRVSDDGMVIGRRGSLLKNDRNDRGYRRYTLKDASGKFRKVFASRLVLSTFVSAPFPGADAAHENGVNYDDRVENLSWKTHADNESDKLIHGTAVLGQKSHLAKMTDAQASNALSLWETGNYTLKQIGDLYGVTKQAVWALKEGRSRKNVPMQITDF